MANFTHDPEDWKFMEQILRGNFDRSLSHKDHLRIGWLLLQSTFAPRAEAMFQAIIEDYWEHWLKKAGQHPFCERTTRLWLGRLSKVMMLDELVCGATAASFEIFHERWEDELLSDRRKIMP